MPALLGFFPATMLDDCMTLKRYEDGFEDGVNAMLNFFRYNLSGSSTHIERDHIERWLDKAKKRFLKVSEEAKA